MLSATAHCEVMNKRMPHPDVAIPATIVCAGAANENVACNLLPAASDPPAQQVQTHPYTPSNPPNLELPINKDAWPSLSHPGQPPPPPPKHPLPPQELTTAPTLPVPDRGGSSLRDDKEIIQGPARGPSLDQPRAVLQDGSPKHPAGLEDEAPSSLDLSGNHFADPQPMPIAIYDAAPPESPFLSNPFTPRDQPTGPALSHGLHGHARASQAQEASSSADVVSDASAGAFSGQQQPPADVAKRPTRATDLPLGPVTKHVTADEPSTSAQHQQQTAAASSQPDPGVGTRQLVEAASKAAGSYDLDLLQQMHVCTVGVLGFPEGQHHAVVIRAADELCSQHGSVHKACCYTTKQNRPFALVKMASAEVALTAVQVSTPPTLWDALPVQSWAWGSLDVASTDIHI